MLHIENLKASIPVFKALSSEVRIEILELIAKQKKINMSEIANKLNISNGTVTMHIKKLAQSGLVKIDNYVGKHGTQKICSLTEDKLIIDIIHKNTQNSYEVEIAIGHYTNYEVFPTCGIATKDSIIGLFDDPRYFADPRRVNASILWFSKGFLEYKIPNYLQPNQKIYEIQISMELGSEAPGYCDNWPSDIYFYINNVELGYWTSPGDFGGVKGIFTPSWWSLDINQYGLLKILSVNGKGSFIDGLKISDVTIDDINLNYKSDINLKLAVPEKAKNLRGMTLYGKNFGNYNQGIKVRILYEEI